MKFIFNVILFLIFFLDIDECVEELYDCYVIFYCVNVVGLYDCLCNQLGYSYNGIMCVGILCYCVLFFYLIFECLCSFCFKCLENKIVKQYGLKYSNFFNFIFLQI